MVHGYLGSSWFVSHAEGGWWTAGGQKWRWSDCIFLDLKKCGLRDEWRESTQDRSFWASIVKEVTDKLNVEAEKSKMQKKDEQRKRRERVVVDVQDGVKCVEPHCAFIARNAAGLVNHRRQKHCEVARLTLPCRYCG